VSPRAEMIRCVLVHELAVLRQGLRRLLEDEPDVRVVAEAENGAEALRTIHEHRPEVVIADARILAGSAHEAERMILQESPKTTVIFLPAHGEEGTRPAGSESPKILPQQTSADELIRMIRSAGGVEGAIGAGGAEVSEFPAEDLGSRKRALTAREREVLKLLAEGRTVRSVASILGLSVKTVDAHKFNLMRKLGIHNKAELVMWAIQKKVVKLPVNF